MTECVGVNRNDMTQPVRAGSVTYGEDRTVVRGEAPGACPDSWSAVHGSPFAFMTFVRPFRSRSEMEPCHLPRPSQGSDQFIHLGNEFRQLAHLVVQAVELVLHPVVLADILSGRGAARFRRDAEVLTKAIVLP